MKARMRVAVAAAAVMGSLALAGCGQADTAAIVDGRVISESDVMVATQQYNDQLAANAKKQQAAGQQPTQQPITTDAVVNWLIWSPAVIAAASAYGQPQSESMARAALTAVQDPAPTTVELIRAQNALNIVKGDATASAALLAKVARLKVTVNPRYGTFDPQGGLLTTSAPNWLPKPTTN